MPFKQDCNPSKRRKKRRLFAKLEKIQISVYRTLGGIAALGPRIYEGAVAA
jgi:hypothetical protein